MPFKSKAQMRWMYSQKPEMAKEWASVTPSAEALPERKKNGKRKKAKKSKKASPRRRKNVSRRSKRRQKAH